MLKVLILIALLGLAYSAPTEESPKQVPEQKQQKQKTGKELLYLSEALPLNTVPLGTLPASTAKLAPIVQPLAPLLYSRLAYMHHYPLQYTYSAPLAELPTTYSVTQHGYHITY